MAESLVDLVTHATNQQTKRTNRIIATSTTLLLLEHGSPQATARWRGENNKQGLQIDSASFLHVSKFIL
jgi:hypothetical protein